MGDYCPAVYSVAEAAALLNMSDRAVYRLINAGTFPAPVVKAGKRYLIPRAQLDQLLATGDLEA
ncbi:helix-turn-helix domain-containing protein [Corynebacterium pseudopelargi]|uniref:Helix-turn-helix domain protein n=1 Tax=Corynebacterium pseudopelargi TaxID=2080757 RepID=A0A3G6ISL9_9CORY|nr:helix-turn-helix domain-containing protein [Corynebacterium pseudopelargi]AZA08631.1 Helix-turn-helix domain protein [Corynebacterium pseudopelargi]